ncbi:non-homologous end-joining DNA ligase [Saccharopolyspora sp. HNM0983]|uniref:Non-homologous end-joining DNA ligase n=1 Tax=Saccharopolyspora montiporae TaxID=2781240 RepID=A0A929BDE4_9PSEU|nr:non-homologous end-joining DNA ligase [Saccharopolyspora sp. HNM0983]MBE9376315.1 non-homologous end-joining DNA ligase [Saccharopolyspora sp. HNM0983]
MGTGAKPAAEVAVDVQGRRLTLSNLDKVLYPETGFAKRDVLDYYQRVAPALLPHVRERAATLIRFPDGVGGGSFFEKNISRHAPDWVPTARVVSGAQGRGRATNHHVRLDDLPTLVWTANLAALELHVPQWTVGPGDERRCPDLLVFDLDPGEPATIVECCRVAEQLREEVGADGLRPYPKTSGSKGMQVYCPVRTDRPERTAEYAKDLAWRMSAAAPDRVLARMARAERHGKVFIDWSQNNTAKTTVAPYSLRARAQPTVSTPVTWAEVLACRRPADLAFTSADVLARLADGPDPMADLHTDPTPL